MNFGIFKRQEKKKKRNTGEKKKIKEKEREKETKKTGSFWFYVILWFLESKLF